MNQKKRFVSDAPPQQLLHEVSINGRRLRKGMLVSVHRRPGLPGGKWVFLFAEYLDSDTLQLTIEGPISREARRRWVRVPDIKTVHRTERGGN